MSSAKKFEDLEVWKEAREVSKLVYKMTKGMKFQQDLRLRNQMRDASVSIMSNVAEGFSRRSDKEFRRFLLISKGSGSELQSQLYVSFDQEYISEIAFNTIYDRIDKLLRRLSQLIQYLSKSILPRDSGLPARDASA